MELKLKIFCTNWINILGIFLAVYLFLIIGELLTIKTLQDIGSSLRIGFLGSLIGIVLYGFIFWIGFILAMFFLDFLLMNKNRELLQLKLLVEWVIISTPFIYWFIQYTEWIFLVAVITFFVTQIIRSKKILRIITTKPLN